jgi:two-component system NtrC family response regulator
MLAHAFLRRSCREHQRKLQFSSAALSAIASYAWPGNIRELENAVQRATIMAKGRFIEPGDLGVALPPPPDRVSLREARNRVERQVVVDALIRTKGNISRAAIELGISRPALHDLLDKHNIDSKELRPAGASS